MALVGGAARAAARGDRRRVAGLALALAPPATPWTLIGTSPLVARTREPARPSSSPSGAAPGSPSVSKAGVFKLRTNGLPEGRDAAAAPLSAGDPRSLARGAAGAGAARARAACWWSGSVPARRSKRCRTTLADIDVIELEPRVIEANQRFREPACRRSARASGPASRTSTTRAARSPHDQALRHRGVAAVASVDGGRLASLHPRVLSRRARASDAGRASSCSGSISISSIRRCSARCWRRCSTPSRTCASTGRSFAARRSSSRRRRRSTSRPTPRGALAASPVELARAGVQTREDVAAAFALDEAGARALAAGAPLTTDDRNLLETRTIRVTAPLGYQGADRCFAPLDPLPARARRSRSPLSGAAPAGGLGFSARRIASWRRSAIRSSA